MVSFPRCDNVSLLATSPEKKNPLHRLYAQGHDYHISVNTIMNFIPNSRGAPHTYFAPVGALLSSLPFHRRNMQGKERLRHLPCSQTAHRRVTQTGRWEVSLCSLYILLVLTVCCFSLARFMGVFILVMFCRLVRDSGGRNIDRHSSWSTRRWVAKIEQQWRKEDVDLTNIAELREQT